jgi:hypothetical protein
MVKQKMRNITHSAAIQARQFEFYWGPHSLRALNKWTSCMLTFRIGLFQGWDPEIIQDADLNVGLSSTQVSSTIGQKSGRR